MTRTRAQASVETVVLLPALALIAVAAWQIALAAWAEVSVQDAAHAGARARLVGEPVRAVVAAGLRRQVQVAGGVATAEVRVCAVTAGVGCFRVRARAAVP